MKIEKAIRILEAMEDATDNADKIKELVQTALVALYQQKPRLICDDGAFGICPRCDEEFNSELISEYEINYCPWCGQRLYGV